MTIKPLFSPSGNQPIRKVGSARILACVFHEKRKGPETGLTAPRLRDAQAVLRRCMPPGNIHQTRLARAFRSKPQLAYVCLLPFVRHTGQGAFGDLE